MKGAQGIGLNHLVLHRQMPWEQAGGQASDRDNSGEGAGVIEFQPDELTSDPRYSSGPKEAPFNMMEKVWQR